MSGVDRAAAFIEARIDEKRDAAQRIAGSARRAGKTHALQQLRECEALHKVVELHHEYLGICTHCVDARGEHQREAWPCATIRALAAIWSSHPDYLDAMAAPTTQ